MAESQAQSTNFKEAFSLFDKRGNGRVALDSLGDLLRACGQNPTLSEIRDLEAQVGGDCTFDLPHYPYPCSVVLTRCVIHSRLRRLHPHPQPPRRLPRPRRARGVLPRLPGLRQGPHGLHRRGAVQVHSDEFRGEDE